MPNSLRSVANPRERGEPQAGACKNSPTAAELVPMFFSGSRPPNAVILGFRALGERGRYERGDAMPSIDIAKRLADAFGVSLDYLVGNSENVKDKEMLNRLQEIDKMNGENKKLVYAFLDAFITKTKLESMMK